MRRTVRVLSFANVSTALLLKVLSDNSGTVCRICSDAENNIINDRKAMHMHWGNQKPNPAFKIEIENK